MIVISFHGFLSCTELITLSGGGTAISTTVWSGGHQDIWLGAEALGATVSSGGAQVVNLGGTASATELDFGGTVTVLSGGTVSGTIFNGGHQDLFSGAEVHGENVANSGSLQNVFSGATTTDTMVSGGTQNVCAPPGLSAFLSGGGTAVSTTVTDGGAQTVWSGALALETTLLSGGVQAPQRRRHGIRDRDDLGRTSLLIFLGRRRQRHGLQRRASGHLFWGRGRQCEC